MLNWREVDALKRRVSRMMRWRYERFELPVASLGCVGFHVLEARQGGTGFTGTSYVEVPRGYA